jgi:predicted Rossmann-fold nucleotide-binding protein
MEAVSRGFTHSVLRSGLCIGVLPNQEEESPATPEGYPNPYVELPICTHLWLSGDQGATVRSRNSINVLTSTAMVVLYGNEGTISEVRLARRWGKPMALYLPKSSRELAGADKLMAEFAGEPLGTLAELEHWLREQFGM